MTRTTFSSSFNQLGLVLQPAGGVDQQHVDVLLFRSRQRVEGKARRIRTLRSRNDRRLRALAPDLQLLDGGGAKSVTRRQHQCATFGGQFCRKLADGGGLAGAIDADHQNDERLLRRVDLQRFCHRRQQPFRLRSRRRSSRHPPRSPCRSGPVPTAVAMRLATSVPRSARSSTSSISSSMARSSLRLVTRSATARPERTRGPLQAARKPPPPAQFGGSGSGIAHVGDVLAVSRHERKSQQAVRCSPGIG